MELDFSNIGLPAGGNGRVRAWGPVPLGLLSFALTLVLATLTGLGLEAAGFVRNGWLMALVLSTTSLGVVMPVLKERGMLSGQFGQALLISALVADFATMLLITVLVAILSTGLTVEILFIGLLFVAFFVVYYFGRTFINRVPGVRRMIGELSHASAQIKVRAAFTLMLMFVVLSETLGTEIILGAFLAGAIVSLLRTPDDADLGHKLEAIGFGFFIPIFFISVGINFNFSALAESPSALVLVPLLLAAALALKLVPALVFRLSFSWRETFAAGALLSARLSLIIAASAIGLRLGVISEAVNAAVILVAILTVTGAPLLFLRLLPSDSGPQRPGPIAIAGASALGLQIARELRAHGEEVIALDFDESRVVEAREHGLDAVRLSLTTPSPELDAIYGRARALICAFTDESVSLPICSLARTTYGVDHIVATVNNPSAMTNFERLGVKTMNAALDRATLLVLLVRNPAMFALLTRTDDDKEVCEVEVDHSQLAGRTLRDLRLPGDVLVSAVRRDGELIVPHGNTRLNPGDRLTLVGSIQAVDTVRQLFFNYHPVA